MALAQTTDLDSALTGTAPSGVGLTEPAGTPDFDTYPIRHRLVRVEPIDRGVRAVWDDGLECRYQVFWLRENAPDAATTHPVTREQALQLLDIPADLTAAEAGVDGAGGLWVRWSTGETSRFHPGWLRAWSHGADADRHGLPARSIWGAEMQDRLPRFDGPRVLADEAELGRWAEALHVYGVAILENLPATPEVIETVPALLGPIRESNFGRVFDVQSRPDADSNAYTSMTLPQHTDLCTREYKPGLQFLHCLQNGANGGDSLLSDGFAIAARVAETDPAAFQALTSIPVGYYNKATNTDYRWDAPMFKLGADGKVEEVRWSPWLRAPSTAPFEQVDALYYGLRSAFALTHDLAFRVTVRLKPGDLLGFDNRRVLHGRTGFDPSTGRRWLRGCYVEREELLSRLRIAGRRRRESELALV